MCPLDLLLTFCDVGSDESSELNRLQKLTAVGMALSLTFSFVMLVVTIIVLVVLLRQRSRANYVRSPIDIAAAMLTLHTDGNERIC
jgi:hypothetical protein